MNVTSMQMTAVSSTVEGNTLEYNSLCILTLVEEDGELRIDDFKDFSDPEKRGKFHTWVAKVLVEGMPVA